MSFFVCVFWFAAIRQEIRDIDEGVMDKTNNPLKVCRVWSICFVRLRFLNNLEYFLPRMLLTRKISWPRTTGTDRTVARWRHFQRWVSRDFLSGLILAGNSFFFFSKCNFVRRKIAFVKVVFLKATFIFGNMWSTVYQGWIQWGWGWEKRPHRWPKTFW